MDIIIPIDDWLEEYQAGSADVGSEAARAYDREAYKCFGAFAHPNFSREAT